MMDIKQELFEPLDNEIDEIKQEIIEYEEPKLEQCSDLLIKNDHDYLREYEYFQNVHMNSKKECKVNNLYVGVNYIKQEPCELVHPKSESELLTLLTTHCDLPTLKDESTAHPSYLDQSSNNKEPESIVRSLKDAHINVSKKRRRRYPCPLGQSNFRSPRKNLFNAQFGRCYETCYCCGQFFLTKSQFLYHFIVIHHVKKITKFCNRKFRKYKYCRCKHCLHTICRHQPTEDIFHSNEKLLQCVICSKTFPTERNLNNPLKVHNGEKLFKCEICSKQFTQKNSLKLHLIIHTGKKPFKCKICLKRFTLKKYLNRHFKIHTGEKLFMCEICSKQFIQKSSLKVHLIIHTRREKMFKCEICSKHFTHKGYLKMHLKYHFGEKPGKCEIMF